MCATILNPDDALILPLFSHRSNWDGSICKESEAWNCGSPSEFREKHCAKGVARCHVLRCFAGTTARMHAVSDHLRWLASDDSTALNGRIVLFWAKPTGPFGVSQAFQPYRIVGAYHVEYIEPGGAGGKWGWDVIPHRDHYCRLNDLNFTAPPFEDSIGAGKIVGALPLRQFFRKVEDAVLDDPTIIPDARTREQVLFFCAELEGWQESLRAEHKSLQQLPASASSQASRFPTMGSSSEKGLQSLELPTSLTIQPSGPKSPKPPPPASSTPAPEAGIFSAPEVLADIQRNYGDAVLTRIRTAAAERKMTVFIGLPGAGKSHVARHALGKPGHPHLLVIPVSAKWRSEEDLLGYTNAVDGKFQATRFTAFLRAAAAAWDQGDRSPWVVVFEEFNLSQPEYWCSELLCRNEYPASERSARCIPLGTTHNGDAESSVFLSPALRFVATLNADHTTVPLSPRVLDRCAIIELPIHLQTILGCQQLNLDPAQVNALNTLNFTLRPKGVSFSHRAGESLKAALQPDSKAPEIWGKLDAILAMEVLPKVQLIPRLPLDKAVIDSLLEWSRGLEKELPECCRLVASWKERLESGMDVTLL